MSSLTLKMGGHLPEGYNLIIEHHGRVMCQCHNFLRLLDLLTFRQCKLLNFIKNASQLDVLYVKFEGAFGGILSKAH